MSSYRIPGGGGLEALALPLAMQGWEGKHAPHSQGAVAARFQGIAHTLEYFSLCRVPAQFVGVMLPGWLRALSASFKVTRLVQDE